HSRREKDDRERLRTGAQAAARHQRAELRLDVGITERGLAFQHAIRNEIQAPRKSSWSDRIFIELAEERAANDVLEETAQVRLKVGLRVVPVERADLYTAEDGSAMIADVHSRAVHGRPSRSAAGRGRGESKRAE